MIRNLIQKPVLSLAIGALTFWAGLASAELMQVVGVADGDTLNVRSGPGSKFSDVGDIARDGAVNVLGYNTAGTWAKIRYRGQVAWVSAKYLSTGIRGDGSALATGPHVVTGIKANDPDRGLVVRAGAGTSFASLGVLRNDTAVHVVQRKGAWAMIGLQGGVGWVNSAYLTATMPQPIPSVNPQVAPDGGPLPGAFTVTGVAANDRLWVRDAPRATGSRLGGLMPGAVINVTGHASGNWVQVTQNGQIGYVNASYLTRDIESGGESGGESGSGTSASGFPLGITCRGTEPFWTFTMALNRAVQYNSLIDGPEPVTYMVLSTASSGGGYPYDFNASPYSGTISSQSCSDGMSDITYSMGITLVKPSANGSTETLFGCCNVN
jgi:uncharacterized protein YraI